MTVLSLPRGDLLTINQAARRLPGSPHPSTIWRWRKKGIGGVRLCTVLVGGRRYITVEVLEQFIASMTASRETPIVEAHAERSPAVRGKLTEAGLL